MQLEIKRAQQTIAQLKNNLESIQGMRNEIAEDDVDKFDAKLRQTQKWIMGEINNFANLDDDFIEYFGKDFHQLLQTGRLF